MTEHEIKLERLRRYLGTAGIPGILLTDAASVAWLADTATGVIDRSAPDDPLAIAVTATAIVGVTTNVEVDRLHQYWVLDKRHDLVIAGPFRDFSPPSRRPRIDARHHAPRASPWGRSMRSASDRAGSARRQVRGAGR